MLSLISLIKTFSFVSEHNEGSPGQGKGARTPVCTGRQAQTASLRCCPRALLQTGCCSRAPRAGGTQKRLARDRLRPVAALVSQSADTRSCALCPQKDRSADRSCISRLSADPTTQRGSQRTRSGRIYPYKSVCFFLASHNSWMKRFFGRRAYAQSRECGSGRGGAYTVEKFGWRM